MTSVRYLIGQQSKCIQFQAFPATMNTFPILSVLFAIANGLEADQESQGLGGLFNAIGGVKPKPEPELNALGLWDIPSSDDRDLPKKIQSIKGWGDKFERYRRPQLPVDPDERFSLFRDSIINQILDDIIKRQQQENQNQVFPIRYFDPIKDPALPSKFSSGISDFHRVLFTVLQRLDPEDALEVATKLGLARPDRLVRFSKSASNADYIKNILTHLPVVPSWNKQVNLTDYRLVADDLTLRLCSSPDSKLDEENQDRLLPWQIFGKIRDFFASPENFDELFVCDKEAEALSMADIKRLILAKSKVEH